MPGQGSVKTRPCRLKMTAKLGIAKDDIAKLTHRETITRYRDVGDPVGARALSSPSPTREACHQGTLCGLILREI